MFSKIEIPKVIKHRSVANSPVQKKSNTKQVFGFVDNRPEAIGQRKLQEMENNSPQVRQLRNFQTMANNSPQAKQAAQLQAMVDNHSAQQQQTIQKKENNTGLPDNLKTGMENLSGMSLVDVKVHRNSDKPAQLQAHAYAQGTDIHLGQGQEKHLPHEAWHVVQQKQGRVKPTMQMKEKVNVNYASDFDQMGISTTIMSNEAYADWQGTAQFKTSLHGACKAGDKTVVTQFKDSSEVAQLFLSPKMKAGLVMAEGALTFIAGIVAIGLTAGTAALPALIPAIATTTIGAIKFVRGALMWGENKPEGLKLVVIDALRGLEAAAAILGAAFLDPSMLFKLPMLVFGIAKAVRSLATALTDWLGEDTQHTIIRKGLMGLSSLAHAVEVASLAIASPEMMMEGGAKIAGGLAVGAAAVSKAARTADQGKAAVNAPLHPAPALAPVVPAPALAAVVPAPALAPAVPAPALAPAVPAPAPAPAPALTPLTTQELDILYPNKGFGIWGSDAQTEGW